MEPTRLRASAVVRVIERRGGTRIQVVLLGRGEIREFRSWAGALRFMRRATAATGLR